LAPALFCRAIDWIMERVASTVGIIIGNDTFTDLDYADDVALPADSDVTLRSAADEMDKAASHLGLHVSWQKTKIQHVGVGALTSSLTVGHHVVDGVEELPYLGSIQASSGRSHPGIFKRIGISSAAMHAFHTVWRQCKSLEDTIRCRRNSVWSRG